HHDVIHVAYLQVNYAWRGRVGSKPELGPNDTFGRSLPDPVGHLPDIVSVAARANKHPWPRVIRELSQGYGTLGGTQKNSGSCVEGLTQINPVRIETFVGSLEPHVIEVQAAPRGIGFIGSIQIDVAVAVRFCDASHGRDPTQYTMSARMTLKLCFITNLI